MRYLDSCVAIDQSIGMPAPGFVTDEKMCFSALLGVEARRAFRRMHQEQALDADGVLDAFRALADIERTAIVLAITPEVLTRASAAFPTPIKTLDAIHLATAMILRERRYPDLVFATHDRRLGLAARLAELPVVGVS